MHIVGLITEYNPFHNGHAYHMQKAKELTQADFVVVIMSGNYVQRGTPALLDKYTRTKMALMNGADIVFELPVMYATSSAEGFAQGAIRILNDLGIVDSICFGSECGDITLLSNIAKTLSNESETFKAELLKELKAGHSYPIARSNALIHEYLNPSSYPDYTKEQIASTLTCSNNILGIEYVKALIQLTSSIQPYTIKRMGADYNNTTLHSEYSSASAIRASVMHTNTNDSMQLTKHMPDNAYALLSEQKSLNKLLYENDLSDILFYNLYTTSIEQLTSYLDMTSDLANRLFDLRMYYHRFTELSDNLKTKQYTLTRINRVLLHIILQIQTSDYKKLSPIATYSYARLLGFNKKASFLLKDVRKQGDIPIITKVADYKQLLNDNQKQIFERDLFATHLYNQVVACKSGQHIPNEFMQGPIRIDSV